MQKITRDYAMRLLRKEGGVKGGVFSVHVGNSNDGPIYRYYLAIYCYGEKCCPATNKEIVEYQRDIARICKAREDRERGAMAQYRA